MTITDPFMIRAHVADWEASVADYRHASESTRRTLRNRRDLSYGPHPDEKLDLFFPERGPPGTGGHPVHLFVHGGYWRAFSKHDYAFVADAITASGAIAAILDYSLMPAARMETLVAQVRRAARWVRAEAAGFGGDAEAISASGHSAGAHLASYLVCRGPHEEQIESYDVRSVLLVSGLYELAPITRSFLQPELRLTRDEVARWSPLQARPARDVSAALMVGAEETAPFLDQAQAFSDHLARAGARTRLTAMAGEDHMTIVRQYGRPGSACAAHLTATIEASRS